MKLIDLNKHGGIGANSLYLEIGPFRLVVDSGLHPKEVGNAALPDFSSIPSGPLDAIILTHCHLDHLGSLPVLSKKYPTTPIVLSTASALLAPRMMHNSVSVMTIQKSELGLREYPLYTRADIATIENRFLETPYGKPRVLRHNKEELAITLHKAGHIPGAASVMLTYKHRKIFITGDLLFQKQFTISGAELPEGKVDTLILETTRGATDRKATRQEEYDRLIDSINDTLMAGGPVLMPVFALGRMQEMLSLFHEARKTKRLIQSPIFCTGLGVDLIDYYDTLRRKTGEVHFNRKILKELRVRSLPEHIDHHTGVREAGIYLVSSGMMTENTPSYGIAAALMDEPEASILFVGYCDGETPGGEILRMREGERYLFKTLDYETQLKARVERFDLSGHADRDELLEVARKMSPRAVVLTHGDPLAREVIKSKLQGPQTILDPIPLKTYEV